MKTRNCFAVPVLASACLAACLPARAADEIVIGASISLRAAGLTRLIVEQDVERALEIADQVHGLEHGRISLSGSAHEIRSDPRSRQLYIGTAA